MQISVIIPTYKPQEYIWDCLHSLAVQTLSSENYEILIILNGCREPYYSTISAYINTNFSACNVRLLQTDISGVSNARNIGLDNAQGEYIAFIDDDDYVSPTYLKALLAKASRNTIALSNTIAFSADNPYIDYYIAQAYNHYASMGKQMFYKPRSYMAGPCMKLIHRDMINNIRFDARFKNGEDSLFMFCISQNVKYVDFTSSDVFYYRRYRLNSASMGRRISEKIQNAQKLCCAYSRIYWHKPYAYHFTFYITRMLGSIKTIIID